MHGILVLVASTEPSNWKGADGSNPMDETPSQITFGDGKGNFESVDVRVPAGKYNMVRHCVR